MKTTTTDTTRWAIVDRFDNSTVGLDHAVSVHRTRELAQAALDRWDGRVRHGHGDHTYTGWKIEPVSADTRKGDFVEPTGAVIVERPTR